MRPRRLHAKRRRGERNQGSDTEKTGLEYKDNLKKSGQASYPPLSARLGESSSRAVRNHATPRADRPVHRTFEPGLWGVRPLRHPRSGGPPQPAHPSSVNCSGSLRCLDRYSPAERKWVPAGVAPARWVGERARTIPAIATSAPKRIAGLGRLAAVAEIAQSANLYKLLLDHSQRICLLTKK